MTFGRSVTDWPVGLTLYDPGKCSPGYTLFCPLASPAVYLMDMTGEVVHMWLVGMSPSKRTTPHAKYLGESRILYESDWLTEMDWKGNVVWQYKPEGSDDDPHGGAGSIAWDPKYRARHNHHDFQRLPNGNTLILASERVTNEDISPHQLTSDYFVEIAPDGRPVWVWHSDRHFDEFGFSDEARRLISEAPGSHMGLPWGDYLHTNTLEVLPANELASDDERFKPGNILSCHRNTNTIFIVDKSSGKVVWWWGRDQLVGPHHPNMLPNGHIIVYDNGGQAGYPRRTRIFTRLIELNPATGQIVWQYVHQPRRFYHHKFFSFSWGSVQRLPNGNTLSLDGNRGRIFEVTPSGEIVWEYVNGFLGTFNYGRIKRIESGVYRCYRIPYEAVPDFSGDFETGEKPFEATMARHPMMA